MSRYIDADKTKKHFGDYFEKVGIARRYAESIVDNAIPTADVVEVGKPYPSAELEKYGLTEWKDKDGHKWVMVERRNNE